MRGEKKSGGFGGLGMGISTILVFFVVLSLTTFATLSLVSANADQSLGLRSAKSSIDYYKADTAAEVKLALIDAELMKAASERGSGEAYYTRCIELLNAMEGVEVYPGAGNTPVVRYSIPVSEGQELVVVLDVGVPTENSRFTIKTWKTVNTIDWDMESGDLNLWQVEGGMMTLDNWP